MTRAELAGLKEYPPKFVTVKRYSNKVQSDVVDKHARERCIYVQGFRKGQRDMIKRAIAIVAGTLDFGKNQIGVLDYIREKMEDEL